MQSERLFNNSDVIGNVQFKNKLDKVHVVRTPDGVRLDLPITLSLKGYGDGKAKTVPQQYVRIDGNSEELRLLWGVRGMTADLALRGHGTDIPVARSVLPTVVCAGYSDSQREVAFPFFLTSATIAFIEDVRADNDLVFALSFSAETFRMTQDVYEYRSVVAEPYQESTSPRPIAIAREAWIDALRELGLAENILVEVPLFRKPKDEWSGVWDCLVAARTSFDNGLWNGTVRQVRTALERWQTQYREMGKPWVLCAVNKQKASELDKITKRQRLDDLLFVAKRFADKASHDGDDDWSRDDALLAITLCTALWNAISPQD